MKENECWPLLVLGNTGCLCWVPSSWVDLKLLGLRVKAFKTKDRKICRGFEYNSNILSPKCSVPGFSKISIIFTLHPKDVYNFIWNAHLISFYWAPAVCSGDSTVNRADSFRVLWMLRACDCGAFVKDADSRAWLLEMVTRLWSEPGFIVPESPSGALTCSQDWVSVSEEGPCRPCKDAGVCPGEQAGCGRFWAEGHCGLIRVLTDVGRLEQRQYSPDSNY